jgi:GAF domain-containing protein
MSALVSDDDIRSALDRLTAAVSSYDQQSADVMLLRASLVELARWREQEGVLRTGLAALQVLSRSEALGQGDVSQVLRDVTEAAVRVLRVGRSSVWRYTNDRQGIVCLDLYLAAEGVHERGVELFATDFPGYFRALQDERAIAAHDAHTDPRTCEFSAPYLAPLGIGAMLDAPIRVGGRMMGVLCNEHLGGARTWTAGEEQLAAGLADLLALAVEAGERECAVAELRAAVEAMSSAPAG